MALNVLVVVGSVRSDRIGIRPARYLRRLCASRGHEVTLVDPLECRLPLLDRMHKEYPAGQAPEALERLAKLIKSSDAVVVVAGEYNHSIQPALSNLLDHFLEEWFWRPAAIACYSAGQYGGVRAAMQLRALLPEIGMPSIPSILALPRAQDLFDEEGQPKADWLARQAGRFLDELEWYADAACRTEPASPRSSDSRTRIGTGRRLRGMTRRHARGRGQELSVFKRIPCQDVHVPCGRLLRERGEPELGGRVVLCA
jgi:NAD(P)H-dependent FMN reductase